MFTTKKRKKEDEYVDLSPKKKALGRPKKVEEEDEEDEEVEEEEDEELEEDNEEVESDEAESKLLQDNDKFDTQEIIDAIDGHLNRATQLIQLLK